MKGDTAFIGAYKNMNCENSIICPHALGAWVTVRGAMSYIDVSDDTITRRTIEWVEQQVPGKVRYKLDPRTQEKWFCKADLDAWLE
jgi:hypothetical protein